MNHRQTNVFNNKSKIKKAEDEDFVTVTVMKGKSTKGDGNDRLWVSPNCDFGNKEVFRFDGKNGECIAAAPPTVNIEWYGLQQGECNVISVTATRLEFKIERAETGILFSAIPNKFVLDPKNANEFSDLSHFKEKSIAVLINPNPANALEDKEHVLFVGILQEVTQEGIGIVVGKRMHGSDITEEDLATVSSTSLPFVLGSVNQTSSWSAVGVGTCTTDGVGGLSIKVDDFVGFTDTSIDPDFRMEMFNGVNAAAFSPELGYDVFTITEAKGDLNWLPGDDQSGSVTGDIYFSTKIGTWDTPLGPTNIVSETCFVFVDDIRGEFWYLDFSEWWYFNSREGECIQYSEGYCLIQPVIDECKEFLDFSGREKYCFFIYINPGAILVPPYEAKQCVACWDQGCISDYLENVKPAYDTKVECDYYHS
ncbi:hypothetical protein ACHAXM_008737 [Skeletonema potamos]